MYDLSSKSSKTCYLQPKFYPLGVSSLVPWLCACIKSYKSLNVFLLETSCQFLTRLQMGPSVEVVQTICSNAQMLFCTIEQDGNHANIW